MSSQPSSGSSAVGEAAPDGPLGSVRWSTLRILVTGAGGFIGQRLLKTLVELGAAGAVGLYRDRRQATGAGSVVLDLQDRAAALRFGARQRFDLVFHLAGKIDHGVRPGIYQEQFATHVETTLNLLDAVAVKGTGRFIHVGSCAEYGRAPCPHAVDCQERPASAYGVSKLAATKVVLARASSEGLPAVVVRPYLVYGEGQSAGSLLAMALAAARAHQEFPATWGEQTRDWTSVDKIVGDMLLAATAPLEPGQILNLCSGVEIKVRDVLLRIQSHYPGFTPLFGQVPYRQNELMRSAGVAFNPISRADAWQQLDDFICASGRSAGSVGSTVTGC